MMGKDKIQSEGREKNAAQPLNAADDNGGAERYPPVAKDDHVERTSGEPRTFAKGNPAPRQGAGDSTPPSTNDGRMGPGGDPAEGKR